MSRAMRVLVLALLAAAAPLAARTVEPPQSALHGYVLGRYAAADDNLDRAAQYFGEAHGRDPGAPVLARRAFELALAAGDRPRAVALANSLAATPQSDSTVALVRLADALSRRDWTAADAVRPALADAGYAAVVGPIAEAWTLYGRGNADAAFAKLDPARFTGFARSYVLEQRAHMLAAAGRWKDAADAYDQLVAGAGGGASLLRVAEADALAQSGDKAAAARLLTVAGDEVAARSALARLNAGKRIGALAPDARRGVGWMMARLATDLSRDRPVALAVAFARVATFLAPDSPVIWLIAGDVLARNGQDQAALEAYDHIARGDPFADVVTGRRAELLERSGQGDAAGKLLTAAASAPGATAADWSRLGDWHRRGSRQAEAARAYDRAVTLSADGPQRWAMLFLRGSARERAGDWTAAETDLRAALAVAPEEPVILNYLGYSLLDRGQKLDEAQALTEKAARLRPGDGGITDSLGWMQYRRGQFEAAVATMERAAALEPTDPTVTEHYGDALWRIGRRIEARFKWRAALDLDPDAKQKAELLARLDYGLDAALALGPTP